MSTSARHQIIDGDGHVVEDISTIWKYMPQEYVGRSFSDARGRSPFPPIDHLHSANRHFTPKGAFANVGREGWELFLEEVGIGTTVLYPSAGPRFRQDRQPRLGHRACARLQQLDLRYLFIEEQPL